MVHKMCKNQIFDVYIQPKTLLALYELVYRYKTKALLERPWEPQEYGLGSNFHNKQNLLQKFVKDY